MKFEIPRSFSLVCLSAFVALAGCSSSSLQPQLAATSKPSLNMVITQGNQLVYQKDGNVLYSSEREIEAFAYAWPWLIWVEDDITQLTFARFTGSESNLEVKKLPPLGHDADLLCWAQIDEYNYDLFVHDGDAYFYHYWLNTESLNTKPVRKIATNPEIESCALTGTQLVFADPFLGELEIERSPETDAIIRKADRASLKALKQTSLSSAVIEQADNLLSHKYDAVLPSLETTPVADYGDAADDPVVLAAGLNSWIVGTNKKRGLAVYDMSGKEIHFLPRGRLNNVDAVELDQGQFLLAASNRTDKSIDLFTANPAKNSFNFIASIPLTMDDPYGLCMGEINGKPQVFVGDSEGLVEQWQLNDDYKTGQKLASFDYSSQTEGCVFDKQTQLLYIGQEEKGIWQIDLSTQKQQLIETIDNGNLVADIEGMDIYYGENEKLMVVSSQGEDAYAIYQMNPWQLKAKFVISADIDKGIDGASETDGLAISNQALPEYPMGVLVVQDGRNRAPLDAQSFKVIDWSEIKKLF